MIPSLVRFLRTPKGLFTLILAAVLVVAAFGPRQPAQWTTLGIASLVAMLIDAPILRVRKGAWEFPSGALLTGMLVAMVMSPLEPFYVPTIASVIGIVSKYLFRTRHANVFNPAALGLVVTYHAFGAGHSWWGALPDLSLAIGVTTLVVTGVWIADRLNKLPLVLTFLGVFYGLFTITAFAGEPARVAEVFIAPDLHAALFFAFFILTDPPTSPVRHRDQMICGTLVALVCWMTFETAGVVYFLLAGVLVGNVYEAWRRERLARARLANAV